MEAFEAWWATESEWYAGQGLSKTAALRAWNAAAERAEALLEDHTKAVALAVAAERTRLAAKCDVHDGACCMAQKCHETIAAMIRSGT